MRPSPLVLSVVVAALLSAAPTADAQTRPEPRLTFSIFGGVAGAGELWSVDRQPLSILNAPSATPDTIALRRSMTTGLIAGLAATLFRSTHLGVSAEAVYVGLPLDSECRMLTDPDPSSLNRQVCEDVTAKSRTASVVAFSAGITYRVAARGAISPYVRVHGGASVRSSSVVQTSGRFLQTGVLQDRVIFAAPAKTLVHPTVAAAIGVMVPVSPGYLIRLELSDRLVALDRVTGPDQLANPPTERFFDHVPALSVSLDIVLERRRGRRF